MENKRRKRFIAYFNGPPLSGDRAKLMKKTHLTKGRVSQLFDEAQPFGERAAENLATALGLPGDYFETDRAEAPPEPKAPSAHGRLELSDRERELVHAFRYLSPLEQDELYARAMDRASTLKEHVETLFRERFGATGVAPHDKVKHIPAAPAVPPAPKPEMATPADYQRSHRAAKKAKQK